MIEEVIGQLIGAEGIDLALIGRPSTLAENSVDRLTLESLSGDVAVLDWRSPDSIISDLVTVGIDAERAAHTHDAEAGSKVTTAVETSSPPVPPSTKRRVYAFDLSNFSQPEDVIAALRALNQRRQVRTFTIGLGPNSISASVAGNGRRAGPSEGVGGLARAPTGTPSEEPTPTRRSAEPSGNRAEAREANGNRSIAPVDPPAGSDQSRRASTEEIDLDDLLDQLDQADP
jgi:hypothetical protein